MSSNANAPLGLMGGTFDPIHNGHLRLAMDAIEALSLAEVRWIPSGTPGHRDAPHASTADRLVMLEAALTDEPRFTLDRAECESGAPTYTVHMLQRLRCEFGNERPLVMIIGMDSFVSLATWREWESLFDLTHFAIAERPGYALDLDKLPARLAQCYREREAQPVTLMNQAHGCIVHFPSATLGISSSDVRARITRGNSPRYLIPETVLRYIESKGLYR